MSTSVWILLGIVALFALPILFGMVRDYLGFNSNKFYGDEANKNKVGSRGETYEKSSLRAEVTRNQVNGGSGDNGGDQ